MQTLSISDYLDEARRQGLIPPGGSRGDGEPVARPAIVPDRAPDAVTLAQLDDSHPLVRKAIVMARTWAERKWNGVDEASLVLVGPTGVGKTHIARAVLWSMVQAAVDDDGAPIAGTERPVGRFYVANDLIQQLDASTRAGQLVGNAPILVIDDVGAEQNIEFVSGDGQQREKQQRYFKLINYCYDFRVSLVITSNLSLGALKDTFGDRAWSRLQQMAPAGFMLDMSGAPDWRVKRSGR